MTNMPEAKLAREAEICYATVAMVTDYDCWHDAHAHVTVDQVVKTLLDNADKARALIKQVVPKLSGRHSSCTKGCHHALDAALITHPEARDPALLARLDAVAGRLLGGRGPFGLPDGGRPAMAEEADAMQLMVTDNGVEAARRCAEHTAELQ